MKKRILASLLALALVLTMLPTAFAAEPEAPAEPEASVTTEQPEATTEDTTQSAAEPETPEDEAEQTNLTGSENEIMLTAEGDKDSTTQAMSGNCGATDSESSVTWALAANGSKVTVGNEEKDAYTLTISGSGAMADYTVTTGDNASDNRPWSAYVSTITQVQFSEGITHIGSRTCSSMTGLTSCVIPASVVKIGSDAFSSSGLTDVTFASNGKLKTIGSGAFWGTDKLKIALTIPDSVETIEQYAFQKAGITSLNLGSGVKEIGNFAFSVCPNLTGELTIPDSVTTLGTKCFNSSPITSVQFGSRLTTIGDSPFLRGKDQSNNDQSKVTFGSSNFVVTTKMTSLGSQALYGLSFTALVIDSGSGMTFAKNTFQDLSKSGVHTIVLTNASSPTFSPLSINSSFNSLIIYGVADSVTTAIKPCTKKDGADGGNEDGALQYTLKPIYAVTNGGTFAANTTFEAGKLATPTKEGFEFGGWYYTNNGAETKVESNTTLTAGTTYAAKWNSKITFDANGGSLPEGSTSPITVAEGQKISSAASEGAYTLPTPTNNDTNKTFAGWNTERDGSGKFVTKDTVPTGNMTLYAIWGTKAGESGYEILPIVAQTYTGDELRPTVWVVDSSGNKFSANEVAYENNTDAGTATAKVTVSGTEYTVNFTINPKLVTKPTADSTEYTYNGTEQTYNVTSTADYTVTGNKQTNAGTYTVTVALNGNTDGHTNRKWADDSTDAVTFTFTINKATPNISITADPTSLSGGGPVTLTVSEVPEGGSAVVTCDNEITVTNNKATLPNETKTYTFTATYAGDSNHEAASATCTVAVTRRSSGGGGGGSSSSSSTTTQTTTNPDGSKTTTVTDKKTGTVTETTKNKDGSTLIVETKEDGTVTTTDTAKNGVKTVTTDKPGEAVTAKVTVPKSVGTATVSVPAKVTPGTVAVDAKTGEIVKLSVPTEDGLTVKLDGSADLILVDNSKDFTDTADHWAEDAIDFATAHEMFGGTSETTFTPNAPMTRAMLMTVLARFDGHDTEGGANWYDKGLEWAKQNGVSDGSNPNGNITREQFATMLYKYAGSPTVVGGIGHFTDAGKVSGYAADALRWAVENGIIGGMGDGTLAPQGNATRAQVATMLMRFVENLTK